MSLRLNNPPQTQHPLNFPTISMNPPPGYVAPQEPQEPWTMRDSITIAGIGAFFWLVGKIPKREPKPPFFVYRNYPKDQQTDFRSKNPVPPASVAREAREGIKLRSSVSPSKRGGTSVGIARARQLAGRKNLSLNTIKRMRSFFARHEVDKKAKGFRRGEKGYPSKGLQAWKLWGGDSGKKWAKKF